VAINWSNAARHDVARIFDFNAAYDPRRAATIDGRLAQRAESCALNPMVGRLVVGSIRDRSLTDNQYVIRYRVDSEDEITILGIGHTRENSEHP
jgi:plasmid stabilization system protein ParE